MYKHAPSSCAMGSIPSCDHFMGTGKIHIGERAFDCIMEQKRWVLARMLSEAS